MSEFQTLSCLHEIPVVHSSTIHLQSAYKKAKNISVLIQYPCNVAENVAGKALDLGRAISGPFVQKFSGPVHAVDKYTADKIREIELKYPVINTPMDDVINSLNDKTEPIRHAVYSVRDTTTSKIQYGKETVTNAATATVNKASRAAGSLYSFYETHTPKFQRRYTSDAIGLTWMRILLVNMLLRVKVVNDYLFRQVPRKQYVIVLKRLFMFVSNVLELLIQQLAPENYITERNRRVHLKPQVPNFADREFLRSTLNGSSGTDRSYTDTNSRSRCTHVDDEENSSGDLGTNGVDNDDDTPIRTIERNGFSDALDEDVTTNGDLPQADDEGEHDQ